MALSLRIPLLAAAFAAWLGAPAARAIPVDVTDTATRNVLIEVETTSCDPVAGIANHAAERANCLTMASDLGAVFGTTLDAVFSVSGTTATVAVAAADWEQVLFLNQGMSVAGSPGIVPFTTSDAVLAFDTTTGQVLSWGWTSQIVVVIFGQLGITGSLDPGPNDVYFRDVFGNQVSVNCVAVPGALAIAPNATECAAGGYTPVNNIPYDPATGTITALGNVITGPPQLIRAAWAPTDWRLNEVVPEPSAGLLLGSAAAALALVSRRRRS